MLASLNLAAKIDQAWPADRRRLRRKLRAVQWAARRGRPYEGDLARLTRQISQSAALRAARQAGVPPVGYDPALPIAARRDEIAEAIGSHQVVIVCGQTGSGKSTQLPKICLELGRGVDGMIGHTQPRRIAARSVAARIAQELGRPLGQEVGYKVRFTDVTNRRTYVKLMTDGILLAETQLDRTLAQYDTIILDEAHERSLNIDFLLGYLKRLLPRRADLKLIVTSATIDAHRFARHFATPAGAAPVIEVSGRTWPVEIRYRPLPGEQCGEPDVPRAVGDAVEELASLGSGDMLVFMPSERDIQATAKALRGRLARSNGGDPGAEILPLYARLSPAEQNRVFEPHARRRIVIATNVAESSLTVPGIRYVIDSGTARISRYAARSKVQRLPIEPVSQASADQRAGRCGRIGPGVCVRLYSEDDYLQRERYTVPEIQRSNLAAVILQAKALRLGDVAAFPFLDPPRPEAVRDGHRTLFELRAIDADGELTGIGRALARMPLDPRIGRMILAAADEGCLHEVLIIAAALEVQDPRERPADRQEAADECHARFADRESDFLTWLRLWDLFHDMKRALSSGQVRRACRDSFLSHNRIREWLEVHRQLLDLTAQAGLRQQARRDDYDAIHRSLLAGLLSSVALRTGQNEYTICGGLRGHIWPGSAAFDKRPKWIMAAEVVETTRRYLRCVARIHPGWIEPLAPHLVERTYRDPHWDSKVGSAIAWQRVELFRLPVVRGRRVRLGGVDPVYARELLIQDGLCRGGYESGARFLTHNRRLLEELEQLGRKARRSDFLRGEEARYGFYDARLPTEVVDTASLERWRRQAERDQPRLLFMQPGDLLRNPDQAALVDDYPDTLLVGSLRLPLEYEFAPGSARDGITLVVPLEAVAQIDPRQLAWLVPGYLDDKVEMLIRSLPKHLRRHLVPATDTARAVLKELRVGQGSLEAAVALVLTRLSGQPITPDLFRAERLPDHLRMRIRVVDAHGRTLAASRDLAEIRRELRLDKPGNQRLGDVTSYRREGITRWDFGELPDQVPLRRGQISLTAYPTLIDRQTSVSLELASTSQEAARLLRGGLRRLYVLAAGGELAAQVAWLPNLNQLRQWSATLPDAARLEVQLAELLADRAFLQTGARPRDAAQFAAKVEEGRQRLGLAVQDLLQLVRPLLEGYRQACDALEAAAAGPWKYATADVRQQIQALVAPGFLVSTDWAWLQYYPRYFRAVCLRLDKLRSGGQQRDWRHFEQLQPRWQDFVLRQQQHREQGIFDAELERYRWMLEEWRVSLFAQQLGTALPVSARRLDEQWSRVRTV